MVVAADDVTQSGQTLFYPLDFNGVWDRISEVLELLICGRRRDEEAFAVTRLYLVSCVFSKLSRTGPYPAVKRPTILVPAMVA